MTLWQAEQVIHEKYSLPIPAALAAGTYALQVEVVDGDGRFRNSPPIQLGQLIVVSPDRLFTLPDDIGQRVLLRFGDVISLRGYELGGATSYPALPCSSLCSGRWTASRTKFYRPLCTWSGRMAKL